jgi:acyl-CoA reductase-like NAD-dependent aldehyde dehydrogenase
VVVRDHEERLGELEAAMKVMAPRGSAAFGAGVLEVSGREVVFEGIAVRDATAVVTSECDPGEEAEAIHEAAFGSAEALGGERDGCVGRVVCHEALFWAFTEALLACYDAQEEGSVMVREPLQRGHRAWMAELSQVAVGEGATWLRGGPSDSIGRGGRAKMVRSVFTNVEPNWRLARAGRPSPALALIRAPDDPGAHELALACDAGHAHGPE